MRLSVILYQKKIQKPVANRRSFLHIVLQAAIRQKYFITLIKYSCNTKCIHCFLKIIF